MSVLYTRMPRLFADLAIAHGDARYARLLHSLARVKLLILDDWDRFDECRLTPQLRASSVAISSGRFTSKPAS